MKILSMHLVYFVYLIQRYILLNKKRLFLNINVHKFKGIFNDILCNIFSVIVLANVLPTQKRERESLNF